MAEYEEDGKDNETSTTDVDNKTSEECIEEYNPTSDDDNEIDKTSTMIKNIHEPIKLPEAHEKSSISTINFNHLNDMTAMNMYEYSYGKYFQTHHYHLCLKKIVG